MKPIRVAAGLLLVVGCGEPDRPRSEGAGEAERGFEPPVLINAESPVRYPPELFRDQIEGTVVLRLFIDSRGTLIEDSTRVAEGSGHDTLDSAALAAVAEMRFAPAQRDGRPIATPFLQPIHFQHPSRGGGNR